MSVVEVEHVSRHFADIHAIDDISIRFDDGGFYALLGPSGSGKTTLLRTIAGFEFPDSGKIVIDGERVDHVPVEQRHIGMVFQNYALFPNMDVAGNVGFGLAVRGVNKSQIAREVAHVLEIVRLRRFEERKPHQLSGGQRQRVALARAIITRPRVLLLDEPLSALDKALRMDMQQELKRIQREIGITTIFVTHDQEEALTISDRIGILRNGKLIQEGTAENIYHYPQSEFVATFLGDANILHGVREGNHFRLTDDRMIALANTGQSRHAPGGSKELPNTTRQACAIRPEHLVMIAPESALPDWAQNSLLGHIERRIFSGNSDIYYVNCTRYEGHPPLLIKVMAQNAGDPSTFASAPTLPMRWSQGDKVRLLWHAQNTILVASEEQKTTR